jgi:hypothetical protein
VDRTVDNAYHFPDAAWISRCAGQGEPPIVHARARAGGRRRARGHGRATVVEVGLVVALTLPGLAVLLVVLAVVEQLWSHIGRRSPLHRRRRHARSAGGLDVFSAALAPGRAVDLEVQRTREVRRDDAEDGAPPARRIDLDSGVAWL